MDDFTDIEITDPPGCDYCGCGFPCECPPECCRVMECGRHERERLEERAEVLS